jgi:hypothetical protein
MPLLLNGSLINTWAEGKIPDGYQFLPSAEMISNSLELYKVSEAVNLTGFESENCVIPLEENLLL